MKVFPTCPKVYFAFNFKATTCTDSADREVSADLPAKVLCGAVWSVGVTFSYCATEDIKSVNVLQPSSYLHHHALIGQDAFSYTYFVNLRDFLLVFLRRLQAVR